MAPLVSTFVNLVHRSSLANSLTAALLTISLLLISDLWTAPFVHAQTARPTIPATIYVEVEIEPQS